MLLPYNEIRLEFDNEISNNIIELSELFHNNRIMLVYDNSNSNDLPMFGVISKIIKKVELPNGKTRIVIKGEKRAKVLEYLNKDKTDEVLESIVEEIEDINLDVEEEKVIIKKLLKELDSAIKDIPYLSNSSINLIKSSNDLSMVTDVIASSLPISLKRVEEYLYECNSTKRASMIVSDTEKERKIVNLEKNIDLKVKEEIDDHQKEFILREKIKLMKEELGDESDNEIDELNEKIESLDAPKRIKDRLYKEVNKYENTNKSHPEASIIRNYIDWLLNLPWNIYTTDNTDLNSVREYLDQTHYDISNVKDRIIEYLAVKQMSNNLRSPIICLVGPPGVGKTSLAYSIAKALNRNFVKISVGGVSDEAMIMGHRRTYIGSNPGKIITAIKKAKVNNPVFLIDEVDKMTRDLKGDPASALLEVLDKEQNKTFVDSYVEEEFDLSNVMFILTANYIENIPIELRDRLEIIELSSYTDFEKLDIAKDYLIKKNLEECGLTNTSISFSDNSLLSIIRNYTREAGVRELDRTIASILRKIATNIVEGSSKKKYIINEKNITNYLGAYKYNDNLVLENSIGTFNALAFTSFGGETLKVEVTYYKGDGKIILTGQLGDVMRESCEIALSYIKANCNSFGIDYEELSNSNIHIHALDGAVKKDGPSAGIAITTAIISAFKKKKVANNIGATGEISLNGNILPIGGLKEKSIGAKKGNIDTIIIPAANKKDLEEIEDEIKNGINYIEVSNYMDAYKILFGND